MTANQNQPELLPLPEMLVIRPENKGHPARIGFTADQMRDYALANMSRATTAQATPAGEEVGLPIFGTVQTVQGQTAYVLILDREAKIPTYAKLTDHATATAEIAKRDAERLKSIAEVAHCGGLIGLSEDDALTVIRRLSLEHFDRQRSTEETKRSLSAIAQEGETK